MNLTTAEQQGLQDYVRDIRIEPVGDIEAEENFYVFESFRHVRVSFTKNARTGSWTYTIRHGGNPVMRRAGFVGVRAARKAAYAKMLATEHSNWRLYGSR